MTAELHLSVAATDLILVIATSLAVKKIGFVNRYVVVGFLLMGLAAFFGIFRFGISLAFYPYHQLATRISTQIGFPLVALGVFFANSPRKSGYRDFLIDSTVLVVLFYSFNYVQEWKMYEEIIGVVASLLMVFYGIRNSDYNILKAVALYTFGGLVVTGALTPSGWSADFHDHNRSGVPGLLKADLFHIIVSGANMLIARSVQKANQFKTV